MRPSIGSITGAGMIALLVFSALGFFYTYSKANEFNSELNKALGNYASLAKGYMPDTAILAVGQYYIWIGSSSFTKLSDVINQLTASVNSLAGQAKTLGVSIDVTKLSSALVPSPLFYYLFAVIGGFVGGILLLRKESRLLDAAFAPIYPALIYTVIFFVGSTIISSELGKQSAAAAFLPQLGFGIFDYLMVFITMYAFVLIGTLSAAGIWQIIARARTAQAPAPAAQPDEEETEEEDEEESDDDEEPEEEPEEKKPKAKKGQAGLCPKCKQQNKISAKFCTKCGTKL